MNWTPSILNEMKKLFGTDGVRGLANVSPMTPEMALSLGQAIAHQFKNAKTTRRIIIGKDTRRSSYMLEQAIAAGICSMGSTAVFTGPLPTPGVAFLTRAMRADAGVMISASHNPYDDNGIKFFDRDGFKLSDDVECEIEKFVAGALSVIKRPTGEAIGQAYRIEDAQGRYAEFVKRTVPKNMTLERLKIVIDCANGAAYKIAPNVLWELGAEVVSLGVSPNGTNINAQCGAMHPEALCRQVVASGAHVGFALDGDADRVVMCDEKGALVDGDKVITMCALGMLAAGTLKDARVVGTVMTNMGVENYLKERGIAVTRTRVGDRYIIEEMRKSGLALGGEPSGHVIFAEHATTGDGLIAALQVLSSMAASGRSLSELAAGIPLYPQVGENIRVKERKSLDSIPAVHAAIEGLTARLGGIGRAIVRYSGTEPLLRIMIEGRDKPVIENELRILSAVIHKHLV